MLDLEKRVEELEKENTEMKELFNSLHIRINKLLELAKESLHTEIRTLEDAYNYENMASSVFEDITLKDKSLQSHDQKQ